MFNRLCKPTKSNSFFLFGARGTGKSTLFKRLSFLENALTIDLLNPDQEESYSLRPELLEAQCNALKKDAWIIIDEVQKVPKLLNLVHKIIEKKTVHFALSGSSSRKLKRGGANLLAGRAFIFPLFPLLSEEVGTDFDLNAALSWGTLPQIFQYDSDSDRSRYLRSYVQTYLKEEVVAEQIIRNLNPFRLFLPIAAQMNAKPVNYSSIARDTGTDHKTVQKYFQILEETYLGFFLNPYSRSVRRVQRQSPKFYLFDQGVKKALEGSLTNLTLESTSDYGLAFEAHLMNEIFRLNAYRELDFKMSYLRTKDDAKVDLILERPGAATALVEIKSSKNIDDRHIKSLLHFKKDFPKAELYCLARVEHAQKIEGVWIFPWRKGLKELGL